MNLSVVGTSLLSWVSSLSGSSSQLLLNLSFLIDKSLLLCEVTSLHSLKSLDVVGLGLLLDLAEQLGLAFLSALVLLLDGLLDSLLLSALLGVASLSDEQDFLVLLASLLLDTGQLQLALSLSRL